MAAVRGCVQETLLRPAPRILQRLVTLPHPQLVFRSTGSGEQGGGGVLLRRAWGGGAASRRSPGRQKIRRVAGCGAVVQVRGRRPGGRGVVWKVEADTRELVLVLGQYNARKTGTFLNGRGAPGLVACSRVSQRLHIFRRRSHLRR